MATTYINNNVKFHAFSKSPVSPDTTLGGAVNPSGHTITTSQVRAQDIPAFLNTFQGTRDQAITWLGTNYATPAHNDIAYYGGEFKAGFDTPKCLKYNGKTSTWEDFDLKYTDRANSVLRTTLKNADDKDVLAIHQDCTTVFVDGGNNAATNSNRWSLFVKKADGSILDHFVASTDKIVAGMPSLGYNALVMLNNAAIDEGELDANYVGNTFAGIIHLNKQYANGDDAKFKVTCFEYIGDKLDTTLGNIREEIQDIVGVTMEGVVASVGTNDAATNAGIGVDSTTKTSPKITFTAGSVATGETKLVSGGAVKTYVDTTALAEGGSIAQAIANYVAENAKVSVNEVEAKTVTVASGSQTGDLVQIVVTNDKTKAEDGEIGIKLSAQIEAAQWDEATQSFKNPDAVLVAGVAQTVINNTIINQITEVVGDVGEGETPTIATAIKKGITDSTLADADNAIASATGDAADKLVTAEQVKEYVDENAKVTLTAATAEANTGITISPNGQEATSFTIGIDQTKIATKKSVDDLSGIVSKLPATIQAAQDAADAAMAEAQAKVASITTGTVPEGVSITTGTTPQLSIVTAQEGHAVDSAKLVTKGLAEAIASVYADGYASSVKTQTLAQTGTLTGMFSVATAGTVGTGITGITIEDKGLANAIADAKKAGTDAATAVETLKTTSVNYSTSLGSDADVVTVALGGTVGAPSVQLTNVAAASALATLENKVNAYHEAGVSYKVHDSQTLPDLNVAENVENYKNVILLVPSFSNGDESGDKTTAITGGYVEWLCVNKGTKDAPQWAWEQIGTTEADLHSYANKIDSRQADTLANQGSVYASISSTGYLTIGVASATDSVMGVSKMFTGELSQSTNGATDTAVSVKSAQNMYSTLASLANGKVASVEGCDYLSLAALAISTHAGQVRVSNAIIPSNLVLSNCAYSVENGVMFDGNAGQHAAINTNAIMFETNEDSSKFVDGDGKTNLKTWSGDMPNLKNGAYMFDSCTALTSFCGDLSSLKTGGYMFRGCSALTSFCGDLSSLMDGSMMFSMCTLDAESLECIAETLPTVTSGSIDIGASTNATDEVIATIKGKGWTVKSNNVNL